MTDHAYQSKPSVSTLIVDDVLDEAWQWLCKRRRDYPASADIWWLRQDWETEKSHLIDQLQAGNYEFEPLQKLTRADRSTIELWSARDSLVLKALSLVLAKHVNVSTRCTHLKGHGGSKAAVRAVSNALPEYRFVFRTDVKSFYASIDHLTVYSQLCEQFEDTKACADCSGSTCAERLSLAGCSKRLKKGFHWAVRSVH